MGFFSLKVKCDVCGNDCGLNRFKIVHGWICPKCMKACGFNMMTPLNIINSYSLEQLKQMSGNSSCSDKLSQTFNPTMQIQGFFEVDENNKLFAILHGLFTKSRTIYKFEDISDYELIEDNSSVTKGGVGSAVAGGLLFGGIGAIVGSNTGKKTTKQIVNSLKIKITLSEMSSMPVYINLIEAPTKNYQPFYNIAEQIISVLSNIVKANQKVPTSTSGNSADELRKFKQLLDDGIITQEEFNAKKKQLLGM